MDDRSKGIVAAVVLAFVFATTGIFARELTDGFTLYQQVYVRIGLAFLMAAVVFAPYANWRVTFAAPTREWLIVLLRGVFMYTGTLLYSYAIINANYSNATFITAAPLLPLFGYFFFKEKLTPQIIAFILTGVVGVLLISVRDWQVGTFGSGELAALACIVFFDLAYVGRKWQSGVMSNMSMATIMFLSGSLYLFGSSLILGEALPPAATFTPWIILMLIIAAFLNVFHVTLTNYTFSKISATLAGSILTLETVFALLISILLYSEIPTAVQLVGSGLILLSVYRINQLT